MGTTSYPYVFISYAHVNQDLVLPAIQELQNQHVSLWYDRGIEAGSEWPEFVAEKVMNCTKFVLFISNAYLQSQNCKRELNFAISRKKEILSIFLEDVELTPGMEMQLGTYQAIFCKRFPTKENFYTALPGEPFFNSCRNVTEAPPNPFPPQPKPSTTWDDNYKNPWEQSPQPNTPPQEQLPQKSKAVAVLLAFFLGSFGAHKFYLGRKVAGILYLIFFWTYIPTFLSLLDALILLFRSRASFEKKYKCRLQ